MNPEDKPKEIPHVSELAKTAKHSESYYYLLDKILKANSKGSKSFNFKELKETLHNWEINEVRNKGYEINWNRACQWYEVSW